MVIESPVTTSAIAFDELVLSWNAAPVRGARYSFAVQVLRGETESPWYVMGHWAPGTEVSARTSVNGQRDAQGRVSTDTLVLQNRSEKLRVRVVLHEAAVSDLKGVAVSLLNVREEIEPLASRRRVWGTELAVPQLCQLDYPGGEVWCSPTSTGMVLWFWGNVLRRSELRQDVPQLAAEMFDPAWGGTGNWPFNTAYAGSFADLRAKVVRLSDIVELEAFIEAGIPVPVSVSYSVLKGAPTRVSDGHLVVCVGFDPQGDIVVNDPAKQPEVRWVYSRADFIRAWRKSKNTAYLIYPEGPMLPPDPYGVWSSVD